MFSILGSCMTSKSACVRGLALQMALVTASVSVLVSGGMRVSGAQDEPVEVLQVPDGGIQPMAEIDEVGTIHLVYFTGDPMAGDVFYVEKPRHATDFTEPVRVNSQRGSVIATGTVRGAQMALGRDGRVHVAWMGSAKALPSGPGDLSPMLYARSTDLGTGFEKQRNVVRHAFGLDGGGTLAADAEGHVHVLWHAPDTGLVGEAHRRVWLTTSIDDGQMFVREVPIADMGVCGCCGMTAIVSPGGRLHVLYRGFNSPDHLDMYLLTSRSPGSGFDRELLESFQIAACPMSTASAAATDNKVLVAWETDGDVAWTRVDHIAETRSAPVHPPGAGEHRKHPVLAIDPTGHAMLVWTEGMAWARGGTLHWQGFEPLRPSDRGERWGRRRAGVEPSRRGGGS